MWGYVGNVFMYIFKIYVHIYVYVCPRDRV